MSRNVFNYQATFNRLKCGSPEHLFGKYLSELEKTELQCENDLCTNNKISTCI